MSDAAKWMLFDLLKALDIIHSGQHHETFARIAEGLGLALPVLPPPPDPAPDSADEVAGESSDPAPCLAADKEAAGQDVHGRWTCLPPSPTTLRRMRSRPPGTRPVLRRFLEGTVMPWFETRRKELANRPLICEQAFGEALDPDKLERLGRYKVHLDRKLERMLGMLLRLKDPRRGAVPG
jgi:hypothetical protein